MPEFWYVLYVQGGKEKRLITFLKEQGLHAFTPHMQCFLKRSGECQLIDTLMFPSYIFIRSSLEQKDINERLFQIKQLKSGIVKQLLHDLEGTSALLPKEQRLLECLMDDTNMIKHSIGFIEGDEVIISDGPLKGMESEIVKIDRHKRIAYLGCEMMGRPVKISLEIVKKI